MAIIKKTTSVFIKEMQGFKNIKSLTPSFYLELASYIIVILGFLTLFHFQPYRIIYNATPSEPIGLYLLNKSDKKMEIHKLFLIAWDCPKKDKDGECVFNSFANYPEGFGFIKELRSLEGYEWHSESMSENIYSYLDPPKGSKVYQGRILKTTMTGHKTITLLPVGQKIKIPEGHYYFGNQKVSNSFDSRYFGFVNEKSIIGSVTPLLVSDK